MSSSIRKRLLALETIAPASAALPIAPVMALLDAKLQAIASGRDKERRASAAELLKVDSRTAWLKHLSNPALDLLHELLLAEIK
jgi:hypothetical protein